MGIKECAACVRKNEKFLITSHVSPEGDALGAELAFYRLLKKLGKEAVVINEDNLAYGYDFLPGRELIQRYRLNLKKKIKFDTFAAHRPLSINPEQMRRIDCLVALDCSDLGRIGEVTKLIQPGTTVLNIDHHISNQRFGNINWVEPQSSCTCEMIYKLYKALQVSIDKEAAICLYTGILTDSGSFRYSNTSSFTHQVVARLLKHKFSVTQIYKEIYENIPFEDLRLLSRILPGIKCQAKGKIVWFQVKQDMLKRKKSSFDLSEHILNFGRAVKGAEVCVLFKENLGIKDEIRVNFRSQGRVDVNKIAAYFGGGGHKTASGATVKGKIDCVRRKVLAKIQEYLI